MAKVILVVEVPEDCYKIDGEVVCYGNEQVQNHFLLFDEADVQLRKDGYKFYQRKLEEELGILEELSKYPKANK